MVMLSFILSISALVSGLILTITIFISKFSNSSSEMLSPFECGFDTKSSNRSFFSLQFFLVTLVFLIFDIELVLIFPFLLMKTLILISPSLVFFLFLTFLSLGLFWEWNQTMLDWKK